VAHCPTVSASLIAASIVTAVTLWGKQAEGLTQLGLPSIQVTQLTCRLLLAGLAELSCGAQPG
jgi:hypothetical protein